MSLDGDQTRISGSGATGEALEWLGAHATGRDLENLNRFGIAARNAVGVSMANIQKLGKQLGRNHALALELWETGCYEARLLAAFVAEPARLTAAQMERWCKDFDNWGVCDTVCFKLFDQSPHAAKKAERWCGSEEEFVKRAGFALYACLALHDKQAADPVFLRALGLVEAAAGDDRNFVKKGVSWALRSIGRRNAGLFAAAMAVAGRLAQSESPAARWIGKDALRDLRKVKQGK